MHVVSLCCQFPLHDLDHGYNTTGVRDISIGEKTDFHLESTANAYSVSFEFPLYNSITIIQRAELFSSITSLITLNSAEYSS